MRQEVNFYQDRFREKKVNFSFRNMQQLLISIIVLCSMSSIFFFALNNHYSNKLSKNESELAILKSEIEGLIVQISKQKVNADLKESVELANKQIRAKRKVIEVISNSKGEKAVVFSEILLGLAKQHVNGLWLEYINIYDQGANLSFRGSTFSTKLIPGFIEGLKMEPVFSGREFYKLKINRDAEYKKRINFVLRTSKLPRADLASAKALPVGLQE